MNKTAPPKGKVYDILYRPSQYGTWEGVQVEIPMDLDPKKDRLEYVKEQLDKKGIEYFPKQVKFGKLNPSKSEK